MGPIKPAPKVVGLPAQGGYVDLFANDSPASTALQQDNSTVNTPPLSDRLSSMLPDERFMDHPLFCGKRNVIPGMDNSEPWMRDNALKMLELYGIPEIANGELHERLIVDAILDSNSRGILGFELKRAWNKEDKLRCKFVVRCERRFLAFDIAFIKGLSHDVAAWFGSLEGKMLKRSICEAEMRRQQQVKDNDEAFRTFYREGLGGLSPDFYSDLHARIALDSGLILHVSGLPIPSEKYDGVQTSFGAKIVGAAAYVWCTNRDALGRLSDMDRAYFQQPFIKIRDVVPAVEEGVPREEAGDVDSDAILGA